MDKKNFKKLYSNYRHYHNVCSNDEEQYVNLHTHCDYCDEYELNKTLRDALYTAYLCEKDSIKEKQMYYKWLTRRKAALKRNEKSVNRVHPINYSKKYPIFTYRGKNFYSCKKEQLR